MYELDFAASFPKIKFKMNLNQRNSQLLKKSVEPGLTKPGGWGRSSVLSVAFTSESFPMKTDGSTAKIKSAVLLQDPLRSEKIASETESPDKDFKVCFKILLY